MELTQTLNQKETAQLLSGFLGNLDSHEKPVLIYKTTGVKLDKPFFMDIHEGSFTTDDLLKKYPLSDNQKMFIFVLSKSMDYKHYFKVTDLTTKGDITTSSTKNNGILNNLESSQHFSAPCFAFASKKDFNKERNIAEKTLIVISDYKNIVIVDNRHTFKGFRYTIPARKGEKPLEARVTCVYEEDSRLIIRGRDKHKVDTVRLHYQNHDIDPSGYFTKYFKQRLLSKLDKRKGIKELVSTDYTSDINKLLDEIISLKNMALAELINIDTIDTPIAYSLLKYVESSYNVIRGIELLVDNLKAIKEEYNNGNMHPCTHWTPELVEQRLEDFMKSIIKIKQKLFDELQQTDI
jgi:hypothetical protein